MSLTIFYNQKNSFLGYKNKKLKRSKNWHFSKVVKPFFGPNMTIIPTCFFLSNIGKENVFYVLLERKNAFLGYKSKKLKKSKNWLFYKGVNWWLLSKNDHYTNPFFRQYRQWQCLLRYSRTIKRLARL